jgi:hypothetical protein
VVRGTCLAGRQHVARILLEVRTQILDGAALAARFRAVCDLCVVFDPVGLDVSYGLACDLDMDELYSDHRIESSALLEFVARSTARGVFKLGECDLHIRGASVEFNFTLCHESDIHFESRDMNLVDRVARGWTDSGLTLAE